MAANTDTVVVGCKLPQGLLLQVDDQTVRINGAARYNMPRPGKMHLSAGKNVHAADGLTVLDRGFWEKWLEAHREYGPVMQGLIYASSSPNKAKSAAEKTADVKTGFEALNPKAPGKDLAPTDETLEMLVSGAPSTEE